MIHVRVVSPPEVTEDLLAALLADSAVSNVIVGRGSVRNPAGDSVQFDVLRVRANEVVELLRSLGVGERGSISLEDVATSISPTVPGARRRSIDESAPVWEEVDARIRSGGDFPPSWYVLLIIAGLIAAVGLLTNSQILIVGAMVVGPEYGAIVSLAFGLMKRDGSRAANSVFALTLGFTLAVIAALVLGVIIRGAGLEPTAYAVGIRPVSHLINTPDWFSVIVAVLAGVVGVVSLTEARASTLIGVFISVTTIPAAADIGVSLAFGNGKSALGSAEQLVLNVTLLTVVAAIGIPVQRKLWRRLVRSYDTPRT
jgi:uncharacterized hydrophobic protein (TIGR00271 family)